MQFSFIHTTDLHLGSPFVGLSIRNPEVSERLVAASRNAFRALVTYAIERHVDFFLIAGDVYDGPWRDTSIGLFFHREVSRLLRENIAVFTVRGNHDAESIVAKAIRLPEGAYEFPSEAAASKELSALRVVIHGRSFAAPTAGPDFALSYPPPRQGWFNIGLLHTACEPEQEGRYAPCSLEELVSKGYQYWALGHVHAHAELHADPHVVYPGNLQGRGIHECDSKGALFVCVRDGVVSTERILVDHVRWSELSVDLLGVETEDVLHKRLREYLQVHLTSRIAEAEERLLILRVRLEGATTLHGMLLAKRSMWRDEVQSALQEFGEDIWLEQLKIETSLPLDVRATEAIAAPERAQIEPALDALSTSREMAEMLQEELKEIGRKLPPGCVRDDFIAAFDIAALLIEARETLAERLSSGKGV